MDRRRAWRAGWLALTLLVGGGDGVAGFEWAEVPAGWRSNRGDGAGSQRNARELSVAGASDRLAAVQAVLDAEGTGLRLDQALATDVQVISGAGAIIDAHGVCWVVRVRSGRNNAFVPLRTTGEWAAFRAHLAAGDTDFEYTPCAPITQATGCSEDPHWHYTEPLPAAPVGTRKAFEGGYKNLRRDAFVVSSIGSGADRTGVWLFDEANSSGNCINDPPTVAPAAHSVHPGEQTSFALAGHDLDGDPLTYRGEGLPFWASVDRDSGVVVVAPPRSVGLGRHVLQVRAHDGAQLGPVQAVTIDLVNERPAVLSPVGGSYDLPAGGQVVIQLQGHDDDGDPLTYHMSGAPGWVALNATTGRLVAGPAPPGGAPVTLRVWAEDGFEASPQRTVQLRPPPCHMVPRGARVFADHGRSGSWTAPANWCPGQSFRFTAGKDRKNHGGDNWGTGYLIGWWSPAPSIDRSGSKFSSRPPYSKSRVVTPGATYSYGASVWGHVPSYTIKSLKTYFRVYRD